MDFTPGMEGKLFLGNSTTVASRVNKRHQREKSGFYYHCKTLSFVARRKIRVVIRERHLVVDFAVFWFFVLSVKGLDHS